MQSGYQIQATKVSSRDGGDLIFLGQSGNNFDLAAQALSCLIETTELFPFVFKVDLYGGVFSVFESL